MLFALFSSLRWAVDSFLVAVAVAPRLSCRAQLLAAAAVAAAATAPVIAAWPAVWREAALPQWVLSEGHASACAVAYLAFALALAAASSRSLARARAVSSARRRVAVAIHATTALRAAGLQYQQQEDEPQQQPADESPRPKPSFLKSVSNLGAALSRSLDTRLGELSFTPADAASAGAAEEPAPGRKPHQLKPHPDSSTTTPPPSPPTSPPPSPPTSPPPSPPPSPPAPAELPNGDGAKPPPGRGTCVRDDDALATSPADISSVAAVRVQKLIRGRVGRHRSFKVQQASADGLALRLRMLTILSMVRFAAQAAVLSATTHPASTDSGAALLFASLMLVDGQGGITFLLFGLTPRLNAVGPLLQKCLGRLHAVNPYSSRMSSRPCSAELPSDVRRRAKVTARRSMLYA